MVLLFLQVEGLTSPEDSSFLFEEGGKRKYSLAAFSPMNPFCLSRGGLSGGFSVEVLFFFSWFIFFYVKFLSIEAYVFGAFYIAKGRTSVKYQGGLSIWIFY